LGGSSNNRKPKNGFTTIELVVALGLVTILVLIVFQVGIGLYGGGIKLVRDLQLEAEASTLSQLIARDLSNRQAFLMVDILSVPISAQPGSEIAKYAFRTDAILRNGKTVYQSGFEVRDVQLDITLTRSSSDTSFDQESMVIPWMDLSGIEGDFHVSAINLGFDLYYYDLKKHVELFRAIHPSTLDLGPLSSQMNLN
jgi:type II secretory pathway pseudopilin PulG